jgi:glycosyltransferase involved in cell wall biosynthesis
MTMRVLMLAHGHPALTPGGTEMLARGLFRAMRARHGVQGLFLAALHPGLRPAHPGTRVQPAGQGHDDEWLVETGPRFDRFRLSQEDGAGLAATLAPIVARVRPEAIHLHHLLHWGAETLHLLRRLAPHAALVATLHDYFAICPREGRLLTADGRLCPGPTPDTCRRCLPDRAPDSFGQRRHWLRESLGLCDALVAPSAFLRDRLVAAGFAPDRIEVLRNGVPAGPAAPARDVARRDRFALFGQLQRAKGVLTALAASSRLSAEGVAHRLDLHGPLDPACAAEVQAALAAAPDATWHGPYEPADLPARMAVTDWVLVPSHWVENAPLVILEAFRHRRPVICSGIGGMAELVADGVTGLHVPPADPAALADSLRQSIAAEGLWSRLRDRIQSPPDLDATAAAHLDLYRRSRPSHRRGIPLERHRSHAAA